MKIILLAILLILPLSSLAEIYKWTDEQGKVHFGDSRHKPKTAKAETVDIKVNTYTNVSYESAIKKTDKVIMYSTDWCTYCAKARRYFTANNIAFTEYDIEKNPKANRQYKKMGANGVPVILYQGKRMNGFSEAGFKKIYKPNS